MKAVDLIDAIMKVTDTQKQLFDHIYNTVLNIPDVVKNGDKELQIRILQDELSNLINQAAKIFE